MDEYQQQCEICARCEASEDLWVERQQIASTTCLVENLLSGAGNQGSRALYSMEGKGRITPNPDTSGFGFTDGPE